MRIPSLTGYEKDAQLFIEKYLKNLSLETVFAEPDVKLLFEKISGDCSESIKMESGT